jgi:DNA-binding IclR family transcriptional regulator
MTCLAALATLHNANSDGFWHFAAIIRHAQLPRPIVRRHVRALKRAGLAEFATALCDDDGKFAGAGYRITRAGLECVGKDDAP